MFEHCRYWLATFGVFMKNDLFEAKKTSQLLKSLGQREAGKMMLDLTKEISQFRRVFKQAAQWNVPPAGLMQLEVERDDESERKNFKSLKSKR